MKSGFGKFFYVSMNEFYVVMLFEKYTLRKLQEARSRCLTVNKNNHSVLVNKKLTFSMKFFCKCLPIVQKKQI